MTALTIDRSTGLGGSDMAAVLGLVGSRLDLYLEKVGEKEPFEGNEATELGNEFEDKVAALYSRRTGLRVRRDRREHRHPQHTWAMAHLDRRIVGEPRLLEIKCSSTSGWGEEGTDQVPEWVLPQVHHYLGVTGADVCDVAALLWGGYGPPRLRIYTVPRDDDMVQILLEEGERFWRDHVVARIPPDPQTSEQANRRWARVTAGRSVIATPSVDRAIVELETVKAEQKRLEKQRDELELAIKSALQDAEAIVDERGVALATWKAQTSRRFDAKRFQEDHPEQAAAYVAESSYRVLRIPKRRGGGASQQPEEGNAE